MVLATPPKQETLYPNPAQQTGRPQNKTPKQEIVYIYIYIYMYSYHVLLLVIYIYIYIIVIYKQLSNMRLYLYLFICSSWLTPPKQETLYPNPATPAQQTREIVFPARHPKSCFVCEAYQGYIYIYIYIHTFYICIKCMYVYMYIYIYIYIEHVYIHNNISQEVCDSRAAHTAPCVEKKTGSASTST